MLHAKIDPSRCLLSRTAHYETAEKCSFSASYVISKAKLLTMHFEMGFLYMCLCLRMQLCVIVENVRGEKRLQETRKCMGVKAGEKGTPKKKMTSVSLGIWTLGTDLVRQ